MKPKIEEFLEKTQSWRPELEALRALLLDCGLTEELKWKQPCYTFDSSNIAILAGFKAFCALSFFKGALLADTDNLLVQQGKNTQSARIIRFTDVLEIEEKKDIIKAYIFEAIEVEKAGLKADFSKNKALVFPEELQTKLDTDPVFKKAFEGLTIGRQRGYNLYFSAAKQSKSRTARIEKYKQRILDGYGFHDCVCGRSKRLPTCDGSHKYI